MTADNDSPRASSALCLDQFLKLHAVAESGGQAKVMIQGGEVKLNGVVETRRRKKLATGDVVEAAGGKWVVSAADTSP